MQQGQRGTTQPGLPQQGLPQQGLQDGAAPDLAALAALLSAQQAPAQWPPAGCAAPGNAASELAATEDLRRLLAAAVEEAAARQRQTEMMGQVIQVLRDACAQQKQQLASQFTAAQAAAFEGPPPLLPPLASQGSMMQPHGALPVATPLYQPPGRSVPPRPLGKPPLGTHMAPLHGPQMQHGGQMGALPQPPPATPPRQRAGAGAHSACFSPHTTFSADDRAMFGTATPTTNMSALGTPQPVSSCGPSGRSTGPRALPSRALNGGRGGAARRLSDRFMVPDETNQAHFRHPRVDPAKPHLCPSFGHDVRLEDIRLPPKPSVPMSEMEQDLHRLRQRQKQIEFGMATQGYANFLEAKARGLQTPAQEPRIPNIYQKCSKRSWDGQVRRWRQQLHEFDCWNAQLWTEEQLAEIEERETQELARRRAAQGAGPYDDLGTASLDDDMGGASPEGHSEGIGGNSQSDGCDAGGVEHEL
eukprot:TRINITY_DN1669_c0_g4_i1.p2 TRINITY_DN1669_c0_g4~~TRINITY_DN1669_c0_g4_i1.p2  ORF type:complete len:505 (+),score=160.06 TRINITY_DN1669_c0_g4_i1:98-1516(+)